MKIGVDARNLVPCMSGIGRYVLEMTQALAGRDHSLILYLPEAPFHTLPKIKGVEIRVGKSRGAIQRAIWSQTILPNLANEDELDIFWGPAHRLPIRLSNKIRRVVTIHDMVWRRARRTMHFRTWLGEVLFMRSAIRLADAIVTVSKSTADDVNYYYPYSEGRVHVVYPGVADLKKSQLYAQELFERWSIDRSYALFVGTLEPRKNLVRLLHAYSLLSKELRANFLLVLAGGQGWGLGELSSLTQQLKIQDTVILTGHVSDEELDLLYEKARFLIMPSIYEGFGLPIIEAQSHGTPVLTSKTSSMPEVAGTGAILVDPSDVNALKDCMERMVCDEQLIAGLRTLAIANSQKFTWSSSASELEAVFLGLLR